MSSEINKETLKHIEEEFYHYVPIAPEKLAKLTYVTNNSTTFYAVQRTLYETVIDVVEQCGWHVLYVTPLRVFGSLQANGALSSSDLLKIPTNKLLLTKHSFLQKHGEGIREEKQQDELLVSNDERKQDKKTMKRQLILLGIALCFFVAAIIYAVISLQEPAKKATIAPTMITLPPSPTIIPSTTFLENTASPSA
jgi:hypothetical protein